MLPKHADVNGRAYAKLSELKAGDIVELDDGFDCCSMGRHTLHLDEKGLLFYCNYGRHYIVAQCDEDGETCIGIYGPLP